MSLVFNTPKSALNTTSKAIQNLKSGDCPEPSLTTESVEYTENGEYSVATPEGFDGLSAVSVTVNIDTKAIEDAAYAEGEAAGQRQGYQAGYEAGETSGIAEGIAEQKAKLTSLNVTSNGTYNREDGYNSVTVNVPSSEPNLETGVVEDAHLYGEYSPSEGYDGFATISVSVSPSAKGTASNPFTSRDDITEEIDTAGSVVMGSYYSVTLTEDDTIEYDPDETGYKMYAVTKASTDPDYPDNSFSIFERDGDYYKEWPTGFSLKAGDVLLLCGTELTEGGTCMIYAYNGNLDETTWASSGSSCPDWSSIGWDCNDVAGIEADFADNIGNRDRYNSGATKSFSNSDLVLAPKITVRNYYRSGIFNGCKSLRYVPVLNVDPSTTDLTYMFSGCSNLKYVPTFDTSNITNMTGMFSGCIHIEPPMLNTSSVTNMTSMFNNCQFMGNIPLYDTSNVTNMSSMFRASRVDEIPLFNTSNVTNMSYMFAPGVGTDTKQFTEIPSLDTSNVENISFFIYNYSRLTTVAQLNLSKATTIQNFLYNCSGLTTLGGFINLGKAFTGTSAVMHTFNLSDSSVLTKESIMNVINNLAAPDDTAVTDATLNLSAASYALLSADDIAIATAKRWSVTSA